MGTLPYVSTWWSSFWSCNHLSWKRKEKRKGKERGREVLTRLRVTQSVSTVQCPITASQCWCFLPWLLLWVFQPLPCPPHFTIINFLYLLVSAMYSIQTPLWSPFVPLGCPLGPDLSGFRPALFPLWPYLPTGSTQGPRTDKWRGYSPVWHSHFAFPALPQLLFSFSRPESDIHPPGTPYCGSTCQASWVVLLKPLSPDMRWWEMHPTTLPFLLCYVWEGTHMTALSQEIFLPKPLIFILLTFHFECGLKLFRITKWISFANFCVGLELEVGIAWPLFPGISIGTLIWQTFPKKMLCKLAKCSINSLFPKDVRELNGTEQRLRCGCTSWRSKHLVPRDRLVWVTLFCV